MTNPSKLEQVARAICQSKTCEGAWCCQWPANAGRRHDCPVPKGNYDDAARAAIAAMELPTEEMADRAAERYAGDNAEFENFGAVMNAFADGALFVRAALKEEK